ncbi:MAG: Nif3-like dinuclear metal center hexameric protein [Eggerthellaceae bacterium]|nr:Nif3-like dinuclear metal center hexameric protein [Eggerthellaceae bacterium]
MGKKDKKDKKRSKRATLGDDASRHSSRKAPVKPDALAKSGERHIVRPSANLTIGGLERSLLSAFPADTAEAWDRTGLLVGERALPLEKVAVTLDPTVDAIKEAAASGANVLLSHHPAYIEAPDAFAPEPSVALSPGAGVFAAISSGVALMCFHTALDVSKPAQAVLPGMLHLSFTGSVLVPVPGHEGLGYGQICRMGGAGSKDASLAHLAARCTSVFGRAPRVWGKFDSRVTSVVTWTGSASGMLDAAIKAGVDCVICGEVKYHDALAAKQAGLSLIELGHDVSEFPLTAVLADAVAAYGVSSESIVILDQTDNWAYPESIRL